MPHKGDTGTFKVSHFFYDMWTIMYQQHLDKVLNPESKVDFDEMLNTFLDKYKFDLDSSQHLTTLI